MLSPKGVSRQFGIGMRVETNKGIHPSVARLLVKINLKANKHYYKFALEK